MAVQMYVLPIELKHYKKLIRLPEDAVPNLATYHALRVVGPPGQHSFGGVQRKCLLVTMGTLEVRVVINGTRRSFKLDLSPPSAIELATDRILPPPAAYLPLVTTYPSRR